MTTWHIETDCLALLFLVILFFSRRRADKVGKEVGSAEFNAALCTTIVGTAIDIIASSAMNLLSNWLLCEISMMLHCVIIPFVLLSWLKYTLSLILPANNRKAKRLFFAALIPCAAVSVISLSNPWSGLLFVLTKDMKYSRGPLFEPVVLWLAAAYVVLNIIVVLVNIKKFESRSKVHAMIFFSVAVAIGMFVRFIRPGILVVFPLCAMDCIYAAMLIEAERRKKLYDELLQKNSVLEAQRAAASAANTEKTQFLSSICSNLGAPIKNILGITTDMADEQMPDFMRDSVNKIHVSGEYLQNLVNDVLDLSEMELNNAKLNLTATDTIRLSDSIDAKAKELASNQGVKYVFTRINPQNITPAILYIDEARTEQILTNLISSAIKLTTAGDEVQLSVERIETTNSYIINRYILRDTGECMSEEWLKRMYEPFASDNCEKDEQAEGIGLRLAIAYRLVSLMNAKLKVERTADKGTSFILTIRFERNNSSEQAADSINTQDIRLDGIKILLCEDQPINREVAVRLLESKGASIFVAEDGVEGLKLFSESEADSIDLILMDVHMPQMDGFEATRAIRKLDRPDALSVPIVAMTADVFDDDVERCLDAGMNDHIAKPLEPRSIYRTIERHTAHTMYF